MDKTIQFLQTLSIKGLVIHSYSESYLNEYQHNILQNCLSNLHFQVKFTDQNYEILISNKSFYETVIGATARQLLRTYTKKGYVFNKELNPNIDFLHAFISRSRIRKNRPMTMNYEQLTEHFEKFSKNFQLFSVTHLNSMVAVGVTIKINDDILYTFYLADDESYLKDSPTTFLLSGIYAYSQRRKFKMLDIGIATEKGILNKGLAHFKQSLGAQVSEKKTYYLSL